MNQSAVTEIMLGVLYIAPTLFQILVVFGGIVFALTRVRRFPKAASRLAAGLTLILVGRVSGWFGTVYLARSTTPEEFAWYNSILSSLLILLSTSGLVLMINAVFVSRTEKSSGISSDDEQAVKRARRSRDDSNPYLAPGE